MAKRLLTLEAAGLTRKERKALNKAYASALRDEETDLKEVVEKLPVQSPMQFQGGFWTIPIRRPWHRATGHQLAAANTFAAADIHDVAGPIIGIDKNSGRPFTFDPWELYRRGLVSSPNILIQGSLRQGKSFVIKRLVTLLVEFGRLAINTSDSKGEHGAVAEAIGGSVFKMGVFGSEIRLNPLVAPERRNDESEGSYHARVRAARVTVLQQIASLLTPGERPLIAREMTILEWALEEVVSESGNNPTLRAVWEKIASPALLQAQDGYFVQGDANDLRDGLRRLVHGDLGGMFDTDSSITLDPSSPYTVIDTFAIGQRGDQALAVTQAVTNAWVFNTISNKDAGRQYFLIREEGWADMRTIPALEAQLKQLKLSGEYGVGMVLIVHEGGDFDAVGAEGTKERELAKSLLRGYANRISFWQGSETLKDAIERQMFTRAEAAAIGTLSRGQFLAKIKAGSYVVDGNPTSTGWEKNLFDTDKQMRERKKAAITV
ncbi:hypothetical protein [Leucobacter chromiireducens]|uniref:ATP-binding protein n=1 Tax=Leucobacter chromiireducens subsp. solipictus TaxID=398235 RepID=A0ABS1SDD4_9MICO|nr:hypothetical protein [Leucobacter chromiireducens]MBL3678549.1 hypothetical protein [Leucobacter chromiireducens subsp. solipictus]